VARIDDIEKFAKGMGRTHTENTGLELIGRRRRPSGGVGTKRGSLEYDSNCVDLVFERSDLTHCVLLHLTILIIRSAYLRTVIPHTDCIEKERRNNVRLRDRVIQRSNLAPKSDTTGTP
jgi:hypothetical protein